MNGLKISFAVVAFVLVQGIGVIWYISKLDSKVDQMYKNFQEENRKDVIENQVKMKLDLENLMQDVKQIKKDLRQGKNKDKEIMDQHRQLFELLDSGNTNTLVTAMAIRYDYFHLCNSAAFMQYF